MKETIINEILAGMFAEQTLIQAMGVNQIVCSLVSQGKVVTTERPEYFFGTGGVCNFIKCERFSGGVGVVQWTLNKDIFRSGFFRAYAEGKKEELIRKVEELNANLISAENDLAEIKSFLG